MVPIDEASKTMIPFDLHFSEIFRIRFCRSANVKSLNDSTVLEVKKHDLETDKKNIVAELLEATAELQESKLNNERKIMELNGAYAKPVRLIERSPFSGRDG